MGKRFAWGLMSPGELELQSSLTRMSTFHHKPCCEADPHAPKAAPILVPQGSAGEAVALWTPAGQRDDLASSLQRPSEGGRDAP